MKRFSCVSAYFLVAVVTLGACTQGNEQNKRGLDSVSSDSEVISKAPYILETGKKIFAVSLIPSDSQQGPMAISVAHGKDGVSIYDMDGDVLWNDPTAAKLVTYYQGNLVVYRDDSEQSVLDRYSIDNMQAPKKIDSQSPSPIAATTLQRTTYAVLGPLRISGDKIIFAEGEFQLSVPITAIAATNARSPSYPNGVAAIAMINGDIHFYPLAALEKIGQP